MTHDNITDIPTYLRLCGRQHKRKYVGIEFMLSMFPVIACWQEIARVQRHIRYGWSLVVAVNILL